MKIKNKSGKTPLFALYKREMSPLQSLVVLLIFIAQLFVMYLIQNNFSSSKLKALGLVLLFLSLLVSGTLLSFFKTHKE